ncbi:MAG: tetratricopeptide repeat protein [Candidatus Lernaella stagnicola]|nr:tetratricopeptide repeat protein [Candidatus Lernaella stagnicola]
MKRSCVAILVFACFALLWPGHLWAGAFEDGASLYRLGQYRAAVDRLRAAVEDEPGNAEAWRLLAEAYTVMLERGEQIDSAAVMEAWQNVASHGSDPAFGKMGLARFYQRLGRQEDAERTYRDLLAESKDNTEAALELASILATDQQQLAEAARLAERVLQVKVDEPRAHRILARAKAERGDRQGAIKHLEICLASHPDDNEARLLLAEQMMAVERYGDAIRQFNHLAAHTDFQRQSGVGLARAYHATGQPAGALATLAGLLAADRRDVEAWRLRGDVLAAQQNSLEAAAAYREALALEPDDRDTRLNLARVYAADTASTGDALMIYHEFLNDHPNDLIARNELARLLSRRDEVDSAVEQYHRILAQNPTDTQARTALARLLLRAGRKQQAVEEGRLVLEAAGNRGEARELFARILLSAGQFEEAISEFEASRESGAMNLSTALALAEAHARFAASLGAQVDRLQKHMEGNGFQLSVWWRKLRAGMRRSKHAKKARRVLEQAAQDHPDKAAPQEQLGQLFTDEKRWDEALAAFDAGAAIDPQSVTALLGVAAVHGHLGHHDEAVRAIRKAVSVDPAGLAAAGFASSDENARRRRRQEIDMLETRISNTFADLAAYRRLAGLHAQRPDTLARAVELSEFILTRDPGDDDTRLLLGRLLARQEQYDRAVRLLEEVADKRREDRSLFFEALAAKVRSAAQKEAEAKLRAILEQNPTEVRARLILADYQRESGDLDEADAGYNAVLAIEPRNVRAHLGLAHVARATKRHDVAAREYHTVLSLAPDESEAYFGLGVMARHAGRFAAAYVWLRQAVACDPADLSALAELVYADRMLTRQQGGREALTTGLDFNHVDDPTVLEQLLVEDPGQCAWRFDLARVRRRDGDIAASLNELDMLLVYCPDHSEGRRTRAQLLEKLPEASRAAVEAWREIVRRDPSDHTAQLHLARLLVAGEAYDQAAEAYRQYLTERPDDQTARDESYTARLMALLK